MRTSASGGGDVGRSGAGKTAWERAKERESGSALERARALGVARASGVKGERVRKGAGVK